VRCQPSGKSCGVESVRSREYDKKREVGERKTLASYWIGGKVEIELVWLSQL
jgi:hypothetical protein